MDVSMTQESINKVGILGGGLIGASWASLISAFGYDTIVYDPRPETGPEMQAFVRDAWVHLRALHPALREPFIAPHFTTNVADLETVDFVQENGPDRIDVKMDIVSQLEKVVRDDVVIATSTSSLLASDIQAGASHPERILVAHPMNPPHLVPMVELVAGRATDPEVLTRAEVFYRDLERVTVRVKKEVVGHLANRLTSALYREAVHIAAEGIADVADIDRAITFGPGLRWALTGPHLTYHLGGGKGGYRHYLDHLGPTQEARWREHGTSALTEAVKDLLVEGVERELSAQDRDTLVERRDAALVDILKIKRSKGF